MNDNLLALAQQTLGGDVSRLASQFLGESQGSTQSALGSLLPVVLGSIAGKGSTPQGASSLMSLINSADVDAGALGNLGNLFGGGGGINADALIRGGTSLVSSLFGDKSGALADALSSSSGIKTSSATNLLAMIVPLILGFLKKFISTKGLNANSLSSLLASQGPHLKDSLDSRLTSAIGFPNPGALLSGLGGQAASMAKGAAASGAAVAATTAKKAGGMRWLPWAAAAVLALFLFNVWSNRTHTPETQAVATAPIPDTERARTAVTGAQPAKVYFALGAAEIGTDGANTIAEAARRINQDGLQVTVTGYTDRSGDLGMNEELAKNRVLAVVEELKADGVPTSAINMQPPMFVEAGAGGGTDAEARRVDIISQ
jgi:outer membrane protein OmpA-like peptidoglycan-associated protein